MEGTMVQILGCGDAFNSGGRFHTCFYVKSPSLNLLIDCGATSVLSMKKRGTSTNEIDLIVISHFHGDHFGGIPYFLLDAYYLNKRTKPLTIITPLGGHQRIKALCDLLYPGSPEIMDALQLKFVEYNAREEIKINNFLLKAYPAIHTKESIPHSLRIIIDNKTIGFSGDTEWNDALVQVAKDADLFICESSFFEKKGIGHISYSKILTEKENISCKRILLTHMGEDVLQNLKTIQTELECAEDGKIIWI